MHRLAIVCVLLLLSSAAFAANTLDSSGNALLKTCKVAVNIESSQRSIEEQNDDATCNGWVWGFLEGNMITEVNARAHLICVPEEVTLDQAERVFVRYLEDHPAELHRGAAGLAYDAFKKAFPCSKH